jgi:cell division protein FtsZ
VAERMAMTPRRGPDLEDPPQIKVLGIGGGGIAAVNRMIQEGLRGAELIAVDTNAQALLLSDAPNRIRIGDEVTKGLGSGGDPSIGRKAAEESSDDLYQAINGADMVFIVAGMGDGTGTGAGPVIARIARQTGALTIGVVTMPFTFEGSRRRTVAEKGIDALKEHTDTLVIIPCDRLLEVPGQRASIQQAFRIVDDASHLGVRRISDLLTMPALVKPDVADVRTILVDGDIALMGYGHGEGRNRAAQAAEEAVASPLLGIPLDSSRGLLINVTGGPDLTVSDVEEAAEIIHKAARPNAEIVLGAVINDRIEDRTCVTVFATRLDPSTRPAPSPLPSPGLHRSLPWSTDRRSSTMMRFDRFTERAQDAAMRAYEVLHRYGHTQVDTEHMLLALIEQPEGVVPEILEQIGADPQEMNSRVGAELKRSPRTQLYGGGVGQVYITPRLKRVIDQSNEEASRLKDEYISTEHLFLAIASERNTPAARILAEQEVTRARILEAIDKVRRADEEAYQAGKARREERRRAVLQPIPLADVSIEAVMGDDPALVLVQGQNTITVKLPQVLALVGALSNAGVNLAEAVIRE